MLSKFFSHAAGRYSVQGSSLIGHGDARVLAVGSVDSDPRENEGLPGLEAQFG